ncbi:MAG: DinB family protein [Chitinophagaceae bacterium]|nr:DinB family protein [Chitinophagaceae bacterium]
MKRFDSRKLLEDLMADTRQLLLVAGKLEHLDSSTLETQPQPGSWSIAQVLEHLNFYSAFYLSAIEEKLHHNQTKYNPLFKPGWFGDYFTKMMKPTHDNRIKSKMKALKSATPSAQTDGRAALAQFVTDQHQLLSLLRIAGSTDLGRIRIPTSITRLISLKLGDTFRFFIAHEQRHFVQIQTALKVVGEQGLATLIS